MRYLLPAAAGQFIVLSRIYHEKMMAVVNVIVSDNTDNEANAHTPNIKQLKYGWLKLKHTFAHRHG